MYINNLNAAKVHRGFNSAFEHESESLDEMVANPALAMFPVLKLKSLCYSELGSIDTLSGNEALLRPSLSSLFVKHSISPEMKKEIQCRLNVENQHRELNRVRR
jgi:hypothetical protein